MLRDFHDQSENLTAARVKKLVRSILRSDLTASGNGASQDIVLGYLPAGAIIVRGAPAIKLNAQFTGGGATSVGLTIGTSGAPTLVATNFDIFGATASGLLVGMSPGVQVEAPAGGQQVVCRISPDAGHALANLTAGSLEVALYFAVPLRG